MSELYKLPKGWEWKKINTIIDKTKNKNPKKELEVDFTYIDISSINNKMFIIENPKILKGSEAPSRAKKEVFINDIIYATTRPNLKNIAIINQEYNNPIASTGFCVLRCNNKNEFKYLFYYLLSNSFYKQLEKDIRGAQYPAVSDTDIKKIFIPLPPLQEQKRIVSKLDTLFEKIDKAIVLHQKNMDEADAFMGSVLNDVFGKLEEKYETIDFNSVCNKITDGSHNPPKGIESSDYLMLSSKNIHNNSIHFENPRYLKEEDFIRENKRTDVTVGNVLLTIVGTIGRTAVVNIDKKFTLQRSVAVLKPKKDLLDSYFLMYSLQKNLSVLTSGAKGAAQKGIYLKSIKQLTIVNLPINIQQKTVKYLDKISKKIEKTKSVQKEKMESLVALKASILDQAFRGEL